MKRIALPLAALAAAGAVLTAACQPASPGTAAEMEASLGDHAVHALTERPSSMTEAAAADLERMREGSAPYLDVERALADGFVDVSGCVEAPPVPGFPYTGAMGHHFVHFDRLADISVDPARPEILLYLPDAQGRMELVGVEFAVNAQEWHARHGPEVVPELAGVSFDPPNPAAENPIVQTSYTLHVWNWKENPQGMFAPFNNTLSCPPAGS
jgi:hypothetical protein